MTEVKFLEKVTTKKFFVSYEKHNGLFVDYVPCLKVKKEDAWKEIPLDNPPTEPFPVVGTKVFNSFRTDAIQITLAGETYDVERIEYMADKGGAQWIYLNKKVNINDKDSWTDARNEYESIMGDFMTQLIETDYRFKSYVKANYDKKKLKFLEDILKTIGDVMDIEITDEDIDGYEPNIFELFYTDNGNLKDYVILNIIYDKIIDWEIDNDLKLFNPNKCTIESCFDTHQLYGLNTLNDTFADLYSFLASKHHEKNCPCITDKSDTNE